MASTLEEAKRLRISAKTRLTKSANKVAELSDLSSQIDISESIKAFETRLQFYDEAQLDVETFTATADLEEEGDSSENYRNEKLLHLNKARELLQIHQAQAASLNDTTVSSASQSSSSSRLFQAKLPRLELPVFSGDYTKWQTFWDQFSATVDVSELSTVTKFTYLQTLLTGEALTAIKGLALTAVNYETAKDLLQKRFGRRERIVFCHVQGLLKVTSPGNSTKDLWSLYDTLQTHIRSLESLDIKGETYGVILTPLVLHKLPDHIRLEWARTGEGKENDLQGLLAFLNSEILRRERSETFQDEQSQPSTAATKTSVNNHGRMSASFHTSGNNRQKTTRNCNLCSAQGHPAFRCPTWLSSTPERLKQCKDKGICIVCLFHVGKNHTCGAGALKFACNCSMIEGSHDKIICQGQVSKPSYYDNDSTYVKTLNAVDSGARQSMLQTARVNVKHTNTRINVLFDSGSDRSYISSACANRLKLTKVGQEKIAVAIFGESKPHNPKTRSKFKLSLDCIVGSEEMIVTESPMICAPIQRPKLPDAIIKEIEKKGIILANGSLVDSDSHLEIDILIGLDYFWQFIENDVCKITECLSAQRSKFGWILSGAWKQSKRQRRSINYQFLCMTDIPDHLCTNLWDLDVIGIAGKEVVSPHAEVESLLNEFGQTLSREDDGRYVVTLPWKAGMKGRLSDNIRNASKRADALSMKLNKDPLLKKRYSSVLEELEKQDIIHEVPSNEVHCGTSVFYLPHRPVVREQSSTTKIRPVFDASAKDRYGLSLNDCMDTGPNLIPSLPAVLLRFRRWKFGLSADITKAFLQIKVDKDDQDVHRFIWDVNGHRRFMRFDRVVFGNSSSPFLLNATIKHHLSSFDDSRVVTELRDNMYVDDWLSGGDTEAEIEHMVASSTKIMNDGCFPLTKWGSNCPSLSQTTSKMFDEVSSCLDPSLKILGMHWATDTDCFFFKAHSVENLQYTKRLVLSFIARTFDPLGFLNPFTILVKILFQELWRLGLGWDDPLPKEHQDKMTTWILGFKEVSRWKIPRKLSIVSWEGGHKQLLCFCDASDKAFGCCVYLKVVENGISQVTLVTSRVRVAPLKKVTLPRLELLGALLVARLLSFVKTSLDLSVSIPYKCFTDSSIALAWIKADPHRWKQFVRNRVSEIQTLTNPALWYHIPGTMNPADLLTRGIGATDLTHSDLWLHGPSELQMEGISPQSEDLCHSDIAPEMAQKTETVLVNLETHSLIDLTRFSSFTKIVRTLGWVLRFVKTLKRAAQKGSRFKQNLDSDELHAAQTLLLKTVQQECFSTERALIQAGKVVSTGSSLFKFSPFIDDKGLIRVGGRLQMSSSLTYDEKHPIVLPKGHLSLLIVRIEHQLLKHAGVSTLLTSLRNKYMIFGVRVLCKQVCRMCVPCQKLDVRACSQIMAPLPADRVSKSHAFAIVGVDHAGPLYCLDTDNKKHYILLFTCATIRAVHLELVNSLSLSDFILALRRFSARRGLPSTIYSDNAKTFEAASSLVKHFGPNAPVWKFSVPLAPWYGGWWERLVRSTKSALRKSLGKALIGRSELETVLFEVEACINSRPLTYVEEEGTPLTPSHFLLGRSSYLDNTSSNVVLKTKSDFCLANQGQQTTLESFWRLWSEDYIRNLPSLGNGRGRVDLILNSIVLIKEEGKPRMTWPLGKVIELFEGKDGFIRAVRLKTAKGELTRSVQRLYKLELSDSVVKPLNIPGEQSDSLPVSSGEAPDNLSRGPMTTRSGRILGSPSTLSM